MSNQCGDIFEKSWEGGNDRASGDNGIFFKRSSLQPPMVITDQHRDQAKCGNVPYHVLPWPLFIDMMPVLSLSIAETDATIMALRNECFNSHRALLP